MNPDNRKLEKKIWATVACVCLLFGVLWIAKLKSVHVVSVRGFRNESGLITYQIVLDNPTNRDVDALVLLVAGNVPSHQGDDSVKQKFSVEIAAHSSVTVERNFGVAAKAWLPPPLYSAQVVGAVNCPIQN